MKLKEELSRFVSNSSLGCMSMFFAMFFIAGSGLAQAAIGQKALTPIKGATYVGSETCVTCHENEGKIFKLSAHAKTITSDATDLAQGCESCHGAGSIHADASGGKDNIINPKKDPSMCFTCHTEKKMEFNLPNHHPVLEGKMTCLSCHEDIHGSDTVSSSTSMEGENELCFKCHKDQRGPFVYEHAAMKEGCTTCHKVHGTVNRAMLVSRDANLCMRCHTTANFPSIGSSGGHTSNAQQGTCVSCHVSVHGSNFENTLRY